MGCGCGNSSCSGCGNPCSVTQSNTPECESLPSQIENFTLQFFGEVVKTEVDGKVVWSLPCSLDVGLPNNPRGVDEGLACYFLRLFQDGITGLTGPAGPAGTAGTNGKNSYTVTLQSFTQPTLASPNVQVTTTANPAILTGLYVFIATSGWYLVNSAPGDGTLFLSLVKEVSGASGTIVAGKLVVPSGFPGNSIVGPQGIQGPTGPQGSPSPAFTENNGFYYAPVGTDYKLQVTYSAVTFVNSSPQVLLSKAGTYTVTVVSDVVGLAGVAVTDLASLKMRNITNSGDIAGSEHEINNLVLNQRSQIVLNFPVTTDSDNQAIALFGKCSTADVISLKALKTTVSFVRMS